MTLTSVDLFCGSGGLSAGFMDAGVNIVAAFDNWSSAIQTYKRNLAEHAYVMDLSDIEIASRSVAEYDADVICGGPPCQDFSSAGKRVEGIRANLTVAFAKIVIHSRPKYFVMENVPRSRLSKSYQYSKKCLKSRVTTLLRLFLMRVYVMCLKSERGFLPTVL